ncbi:MAG: hypothetical protein LBE71_02060 [Dysgonamonadaceae bacterium]|jgi:hypothetical protein|nr:hypothetical protein [Dysgonamonadaceae bacterium]
MVSQPYQRKANDKKIIIFAVNVKHSKGIVWDNAGLWLEHGFCQQDRIWTLEGKKRRKRHRNDLEVVATINQDGVIRRAHFRKK